MAEILGDVNWLAVGAAAACYFLLGGLWFGPALGSKWTTAIGFERSDDWRPGPLLYVGPLMGSLAASIATGLLVVMLGTDTAAGGAALGLLVGLGYSAGVAGIDATSPHNRQPGRLFLINGTYHVLGLLLVGVILAVWR